MRFRGKTTKALTIMFNLSSRRSAAVGAVFLLAVIQSASPATLQFYYDPETGNVAIDTRETRNGRLGSWGLEVNPHATDVRFRPENLLYLADSPFNSEVGGASRTEVHVGGIDVSASLHGLYTVGDILPPGLSEAEWGSLFEDFFHYGGYQSASDGLHYYVDVVGGGFPPPADFIYGKPNGRFRNLKDILDPEDIKWAAAATLGYDQRTGKLWIDTSGDDGGYISMYSLRTASAFLDDEFRPIDGGPFTESSDDALFEAFNAAEPGHYDLGRVLPKGLSESEFEQFFSEAAFIGRAGFASIAFDFAQDGTPFSFAFMAVPEPTAGVLALLSVAVGFRLARRRRDA